MPTIDFSVVPYIQWHGFSSWESTVILGMNGDYYNFRANWNSRDNSWYISVYTLDDVAIIEGRKLIIRVNLLANTIKDNLPKCILYADTDDPNVNSITYDNMVNGEVKLYHISR